VKSRLQAVVQSKSSINETFVEEVILTRAAAGIANRLSEDKLTVASIMADTIMEMMIHQLENSVNKLVSGTSRILHTITHEPHTKRDFLTMDCPFVSRYFKESGPCDHPCVDIVIK